MSMRLLCLLCSPEEELRKLREETNVDSLKQELEKERSKRIDLEQKMNEVLKTRYEGRAAAQVLMDEDLQMSKMQTIITTE